VRVCVRVCVYARALRHACVRCLECLVRVYVHTHACVLGQPAAWRANRYSSMCHGLMSRRFHSTVPPYQTSPLALTHTCRTRGAPRGCQRLQRQRLQVCVAAAAACLEPGQGTVGRAAPAHQWWVDVGGGGGGEPWDEGASTGF